MVRHEIELYKDSDFEFPFSVLKTFIHDPLVEWEKVKGKTGTAESSNEKVGISIMSAH